MEDENIDDPKLKFGKNSSEKYNIVKGYSLEEHKLVGVSSQYRKWTNMKAHKWKNKVKFCV